jgi:hypothetical protein
MKLEHSLDALSMMEDQILVVQDEVVAAISPEATIWAFTDLT